MGESNRKRLASLLKIVKIKLTRKVSCVLKDFYNACKDKNMQFTNL